MNNARSHFVSNLLAAALCWSALLVGANEALAAPLASRQGLFCRGLFKAGLGHAGDRFSPQIERVIRLVSVQGRLKLSLPAGDATSLEPPRNVVRQALERAALQIRRIDPSIWISPVMKDGQVGFVLEASSLREGVGLVLDRIRALSRLVKDVRVSGVFLPGEGEDGSYRGRERNPRLTGSATVPLTVADASGGSLTARALLRFDPSIGLGPRAQAEILKTTVLKSFVDRTDLRRGRAIEWIDLEVVDVIDVTTPGGIYRDQALVVRSVTHEADGTQRAHLWDIALNLLDGTYTAEH